MWLTNSKHSLGGRFTDPTWLIPEERGIAREDLVLSGHRGQNGCHCHGFPLHSRLTLSALRAIEAGPFGI